ncbi:uncharacterized protein LOC131622119 [Vicia villosa]|uniref:uncharacterized protein LOC131622119 n=1 Tax=Vicia villosa TaxID=3911 RepID=UPI00273AC592|nr:uncharacterized protein LOC131622119 [Vicia villosa]
MKDLRPISLCNVVYKVVSKLLANRLKKCLSKCIGEEQSAFVEGRSILDNAMIAFEVVHALKHRTTGNNAQLALKIDISKAYDCVDWGFLRGMLYRLGFAENWVRWMMMCVTSVNYSVLVNADNVGPIQPGRGLRQGDPLSPYLFILITEGLSALIRGVVARGDIHGVQICRGAPSVSHLLFTDDCFLFCRANITEVHNIMEILNLYVAASGQDINLFKFEVFFSRNISLSAQEDLANIMGVRHVLGTCTYLGLPSLIGRSKKAAFGYVKDQIWKKINSWRGRPISKAGKEVMIKSVLQAIPSYIMSLFILPEGMVSDIEKMLNSFWWGGGSNQNGIRWMKWGNLTGSKEEGGIGFRDLRTFNLAMVAKRGWHLLSNPHSLVSRIYKARYFPHSAFLDAPIGSNPSFVWRSIWQARDLLTLGCRWSIGDGRNIPVMGAPWIRGRNEGMVGGPQQQNVYNMAVSDLMLPTGKYWNGQLILNAFDGGTAEDILRTPLVEDVVEDKWIWKAEKDGCYSVRSEYRLWIKEYGARGFNRVEGAWTNLWNIKAPPRVKHLIWRICRDCLPTRRRLIQYHVPCPATCPFCHYQVEDSWHVFFGCSVTNQCWHTTGLSNIIAPRIINYHDDVFSLIMDICRREDSMLAGRFAVMIDILWRNRNNMIWNNESEDCSKLGLHAFCSWQEWFVAQENTSREHEHSHSLSWSPPMEGNLKCNVDAGFNTRRGTTNRGWCFRNNMGVLSMVGLLGILVPTLFWKRKLWPSKKLFLVLLTCIW